MVFMDQAWSWLTTPLLCWGFSGSVLLTFRADRSLLWGCPERDVPLGSRIALAEKPWVGTQSRGHTYLQEGPQT